MFKTSKVEGFIKQGESSDCGVVCLLNIIRFHKGNNTIEKLRELSGTSKYGTTILGLYQAAKKIGFNAEGLEANIDFIKRIEYPSILHITLRSGLQHYIICYMYKNEKFIIGDPDVGILEYTVDELNSFWQSKIMLYLEPNIHFEKSKDNLKKKKTWLINMLRDDKEMLLGIFILSLSVSILGMTTAIFTQKLVDDILPSRSYEKLIIGIVLLTIFLIAKVGFGSIFNFLGIKQGYRFNNRLINHFFEILLYLPKSFFDNRRIGDLIARMEDTSRIQSTIMVIFGDLLKNLLFIIAGEILIFIYCPEIGVITLLCLPTFGYISYRFKKSVAKSQQDVMISNAHKISNYVNTMQGIDTIKSNNEESNFAEINRLIYGNYQETIFKLGKVGINIQMSAELTGIFLLIIFLAKGSWMVIDGSLSIGRLVAIIGIIGSLFPALVSLAFANITLLGAKIAFERMFEFNAIMPEYLREPKYNQNIIIFKSLLVKDLAFGFEGRKQVLKNINLKINRGELIALIGECGGGKTTLINILQRFYIPERGIILMNGNDLRDYCIPDIRQTIGVVPQDISVFNGTLIENLTLKNDPKTFQSCIEYCREKGFNIFFEQFPQGYSTLLGEQGVNISGGQKQLIGICRALFRKPQLLLLDEPTTAMDRKVEKFVMKLLNEIKKEVAILLVTHKLPLAKDAECIYILENGIITAYGNHKELLLISNLYRDIFEEYGTIMKS